MDEHRKDREMKDELERNLEGCMDELEKAEADHRAALEALATKERDASELMKSIGDIRRSCDDREREMADRREAAEDRASAAETGLAECRERLLSMGFEKRSLEEALEAARVECETCKSAVDDLRKEIVRVEASGVEAAREAEAKVATEMGERLSEMQAENERFKSAMEVHKANEEEICKFLGVDVASVDFAVNDCADCVSADSDAAVAADASRDAPRSSFLSTVKARVDGLYEVKKVKKELERNLESCMDELEKAEADHQTALQALAAKERDMSELMKSIGDMQRSGQDREREIADQCRATETQLAECQKRLISLTHDKKLLEDALDASEATRASHEDDVVALRTEIANSKVEAARRDSRLELERDLLAKAEAKEEDERMERIALEARLDAQLREHASKEKQLRESLDSMEQTLKEKVRVNEEDSRKKQVEVEKCEETIAALEAHRASLELSLSEQRSALDASREEEIGRLRGEIAELESRLRGEAEKFQREGAAGEARVRELEEVIRKGHAERKRMHNIIQELRGNVRVFARIRPFIPDDGKQGKEGDTSFVSHDGDAMVTVNKPNDPIPKHTFSFDHVFAPSAGQDTVYQEVSEFIQSALDGYNVCLFSYGRPDRGRRTRCRAPARESCVD